MIPYGMNPFGLEDRTLTFSVLENGFPVFTSQSEGRMYCWASFSDEIKNYVRDTYGESNLMMSTQIASDQSSWDDLHKYVSKEVSGDHFMVNGDQTFYYQTWVQSEIPKFATVYVLDKSESMGKWNPGTGTIDSEHDRTYVKRAITGEIYEYNCYALDASDSKMYVYSASKLNSMSISDSVFGTIPFGNATLSQIWTPVNDLITKVMKNLSGSESMITNLYYSIASTMDRMFHSEGATTPGKRCELTAVSFIMLTDESIFTSDTLYCYDWLITSTNTWFCPWLNEWQSNATKKFPTQVPTTDVNQWEFCKAITEALKQMSYYYGVNFNWGLYGGLATSDDKRAIQGFSKDGTSYSGTTVLLNKITQLDFSPEETITYETGTAWSVPTNFHVSYPHEPMCRIALIVPSEYIVSGQNALKDGLTMTYNDQFNKSSTLAHFHKDSRTEYSAFRFLQWHYDSQDHLITVSDEPVVLPSVANMNLVANNPSTGTPYAYKWNTFGQTSGVATKSINCGGTYNLDANDVADGYERPTIVFKLVGT